MYIFPFIRIRYLKPIAINTHIACSNNSKCSVRYILKATARNLESVLLEHFLLEILLSVILLCPKILLIPMYYELCFLRMAHACPYDRQSSHTISTVTATSYIWVIKHSDLHEETTSPYEGHTSCPSFLQLLHHTSGLLRHISGLPKLLHWLHLTLLTMLALWGAPYE